jgi:integrase/recombinase XerD
MRCIANYLEVNISISDLKKSDIEKMIVRMRDNGLSANTIQSYMRVISAFLTWCRNNGHTSLKIAPYKGEEVVKDTYTDEELEILLKRPNMKTCSFEEYRNWVIINLLMDCGCRSATIRAIENRDVDLNNGFISYRHTKNRKVQILPLCSAMVSILEEYMNIRKGENSDILFCTVEGLPLSSNALKIGISRYNKRRGVQKTSIHLFRHTFARKYLLDCSGDAFTLQRILGHSTLAMTKHYCSIYNADLLKNYDDISPLSQIQKKGERININHKCK